MAAIYSSAFAFAAFCSGPEWAAGNLHTFHFERTALQRRGGIQIFVNLTGGAGQIRLIAAILNGAKFIERQIGILAVKVLTKLANRKIKVGEPASR